MPGSTTNDDRALNSGTWITLVDSADDFNPNRSVVCHFAGDFSCGLKSKSLFWPQLTRYWPWHARIKLLVSLKPDRQFPANPVHGPCFWGISELFGGLRPG